METAPATLSLVDATALPFKEISAVVALPNGFFLLAHDEDGIYRWSPGTSPRLLRGRGDDSSLGDLEGLCMDEDGTVYAVAEGDGTVIAMPLIDSALPTLGVPVRVGEVARLGKKENKGWEGCAVLPGRFRGDGVARLIMAHEGKPRAIGVFALSDLDALTTIELDALLDGVLDDLSDIAVCPETGNIFLLSDESESIAELTLSEDDETLTLLGSAPLAVAEGAKPEGVAFTPEGELVVVTDASAELLRFSVTRGPLGDR